MCACIYVRCVREFRGYPLPSIVSPEKPSQVIVLASQVLLTAASPESPTFTYPKLLWSPTKMSPVLLCPIVFVKACYSLDLKCTPKDLILSR